MKRLLPAGLAIAFVLIGCGELGSDGAKASAPSVATRAADVPAVDAMSQLGRDDTILNQADWRQIEFYPADRRPELEKTLGELKTSQGVYLRRVPTRVTIGGRTALAELDKTLETRSAAAPFLGQGKGKVSGQVHGGFTVPLDGLLLYGLTDYNGVSVLGAVIQDDDGHAALAETFGRLNKAYGLIAVDWRALALMTAVKEDGSLDVWRP